MSTPTPPVGYRLVADDEVIQKGDRCTRKTDRDQVWTLVNSTIGSTPAEWHSHGMYTALVWATARSAPVPVEKEWLNPWD